MKKQTTVITILVTALIALVLCNHIESEASSITLQRPQYIEGDYEVLNYFLDSLGINLPENFPPELKEYVSEGVFNFNRVEKRVLKEELRKKLNNISDEKNKQLYFLVFCEYMRNLKEHGRIWQVYEYKIIEWSKKQGMTAGRQFELSISVVIDYVYTNIHKEYWKEINKELNFDKLEE